MTTQPTVIHWFRNDLRINDNPALLSASKNGAVLPIYILDDDNAGDYAMGGASRWWLHHALTSLNESLDGNLCVYSGNPLDILYRLINEHSVAAVYWNRGYEPWQMDRDTDIKANLKERDIVCESHNASLLWEPWTVNKKDGTPYKVFTPYYRRGCLNSAPPRQPKPELEQLTFHNDTNCLSIDELQLLPKIGWDKQLERHWAVSEDGAHDALDNFIESGLMSYKIGRDYPDKKSTSRLSPYLHFGQISPHQVWHAVKHLIEDDQVDTFCSELGWREFSYNLLFNNPDLPTENIQKKFDHFEWAQDTTALAAWQHGNTGIPMVDAGMRELWQTGTMHNRVRMVVGSFLVKNLRQHWRHGERWFWDCLLDADLASNSASWQWIAGCGADAAPYFRIFNPVTQGEKFDPDGSYIRQYIPEIAQLPNKYLFSPWKAPSPVMLEAKVVLGRDYPLPIVDLKESRKAALEEFAKLKLLT